MFLLQKSETPLKRNKIYVPACRQVYVFKKKLITPNGLFKVYNLFKLKKNESRLY